MSKKKVLVEGFKKPLSNFRIFLRGDRDYYKHLVMEKNDNFHTKSFKKFFQYECDPKKRVNQGLEKLLRTFFPMKYPKKSVVVEYISYDFSRPKLSPKECFKLGLTYSAKLTLTLRIVRKDEEPIVTSCVVGEVPMITEIGSFIVNGHERIFVGQLRKSAGCLVLRETDSYDRSVCLAKLIPGYGSWLHFRLSGNNVLISVDKRKEMSLTTFLLCFPKTFAYENENTGAVKAEYSDLSEILNQIYDTIELKIQGDHFIIPFDKAESVGYKVSHDIYVDGKLIIHINDILTAEFAKLIPDNLTEMKLPLTQLESMFIAEDIFNEENGSMLLEIGQKITAFAFKYIEGRKTLKVFKIDRYHPAYCLNSLNHDGIFSANAALMRFMEVLNLKNYEPHQLIGVFISRFMNAKNYSLENERLRLNKKLNIEDSESFLTMKTVLGVYKRLVLLDINEIQSDAVDDLANKTLCGVYENMEDVFFSGLANFEKYLKERFGIFSPVGGDRFENLNCSSIMYHVLDAFYKSSQQFNTNNYLSMLNHIYQVTHKILGSGDGSNIPAEIREIVASKKNKICVINTPDGQNSGLQENISAFAEIGPDGSLLAKYYLVKNGIATEEMVLLDVAGEKDKVMACLNSYNKEVVDGKIRYIPREEFIPVSLNDKCFLIHNSKVDIVTVSPGTMLSRAAATLPFIPNTDAYRALIGAGMVRQSVFLVNPKPRMVGTGIESFLSQTILAKHSGVVSAVDLVQGIILVNHDEDGFIDVYEINSAQRNSADGVLFQRPVVKVGDAVNVGDILADGFSTEGGELFFGHDLLVCLTTDGTTYEDSCCLSSDLIKNDTMTSIGYHKIICNVSERRECIEQLTKDIPNVPLSATNGLDETGLPVVGRLVEPGEIIVGKVIPVSSNKASSYHDRLLSNILSSGRQLNFVNASSIVPHGVFGYITNVTILNRKGVTKDARLLMQETNDIRQANNRFNSIVSELKRSFVKQFVKEFGSYELLNDFKEFKKGKLVRDMSFRGLGIKELYDFPVKNKELINAKIDLFMAEVKRNEDAKKTRIKNLSVNPGLDDSECKQIMIEVMGRNIVESGDKLAGSYANKCIVSKIALSCDMPYLCDGRVVDMKMNGLSVASRMNPSQLMELALTQSLHRKREEMKVKYFRLSRLINKLDNVLDELMPIIHQFIDVYGDFGVMSLKEDMDTDAEEVNIPQLQSEFNTYCRIICRYEKIKNTEIRVLRSAIYDLIEFVKENRQKFRFVMINEMTFSDKFNDLRNCVNQILKITSAFECCDQEVRMFEKMLSSVIYRFREFGYCMDVFENVFVKSLNQIRNIVSHNEIDELNKKVREQITAVYGDCDKVIQSELDKCLEVFDRIVEKIKMDKIDWQSSLLEDLKLLIGDRLDEFGFNEFQSLTTKDILRISKYFIDEGINVAIPPFENFSFDDLRSCMQTFGRRVDERLKLYDGKTGEEIANAVVGYMNIFKLYHFAKSKITSRSVGPYNTMGFPTAGSQHEGGQRAGEMERWAIESYGAAGFCVEMCSARGNDPIARNTLWNAAIKGGMFSTILTNGERYEEILNTPNGNMISSFLRGCGFEPEVIQSQDAFGNPCKGLKILLTNKAYGLPILNEETFYRKTLRPIEGGLFCCKIFGPIEDYTCICGKYYKLPNVTCEECGVRTVHSSIRAKTMSHIRLPEGVYVVHPWFARSTQNKICMLLNMQYQMFKDICNLRFVLVVNKGSSPYEVGQFVPIEECQEFFFSTSGFSLSNFGLSGSMGSLYGFDNLKVLLGGAALHYLLSKINLEQYVEEYRERLINCSSIANAKKYTKILRICRFMLQNNIRPEWMVRSTIPVIPPAYRPMVQLNNGMCMTSGTNYFYKNIVSAVQCLEAIQGSGVDVLFLIVQSVRRITEIVNQLFGGAKEETRYAVSDKEHRSLADRMKGKEGMFRKYCLGSRNDFTGRAVIGVDYRLGLDECILPRSIVLKLFEPVLMYKLQAIGVVGSLQSAQMMIKEALKVDNRVISKDEVQIVFDVLGDFIKNEKPVCLLNRAPTLHRVGIAAFEIKDTYEGNAILLNPQVCKQFNADFDGDTQAVYVNYSVEAISETIMLMKPSKNIASPTNGSLFLNFAKHMSFGLYVLTSVYGVTQNLIRFDDYEDVLRSYNECRISFDQEIEFRFADDNVVKTTFGRLMLWRVFPKISSISFMEMNCPISGAYMQKLIDKARLALSDNETAALANRVKDLAFEYAEKGAGSVSIFDMVEIPGRKEEIQTGIEKQMKLENLYNSKLINENELRRSSITLWQDIMKVLKQKMMKYIGKYRGQLSLLVNSGASGSESSLAQMILFKGNVVGLDGRIMLTPIIYSLKDGVHPHMFFVASSGTRKSVNDVSHKTATVGYLARKMANVVGNLIIRANDCMSTNGQLMRNIFNNDGMLLASVYDLVYNRVTSFDILSPLSGKMIVKANTLINHEIISLLKDHEITEVYTRSPIHCELGAGLCSMCYGAIPGTRELAHIGENVGMLAVHALTEPATQLTMKSFHSGGVATVGISKKEVFAQFSGFVQLINVQTITDKSGNVLNISRIGQIRVVNQYGMLLFYMNVPYAATIVVKDGDAVEPNTLLLLKTDARIILAETECVVRLNYLDLKVNFEYIQDESGVQRVCITSDKGCPTIQLGEDSYQLNVGTILLYGDGDTVPMGTCVGYLNTTKSNLDIVQGVEKMIALWECQAGNTGYLSPCDGKVVAIKKNSIKLLSTKNEEIEVKFTAATSMVAVGQSVLKGDLITTGSTPAQAILDILGINALAERYQSVMLSILQEQSLVVSHIHVPTILAAVTSKREVVRSDDPEYVAGDMLHMSELYKIRKKINNKSIELRRVVYGLTEFAVTGDSLISSGAFQELIRVFVDLFTEIPAVDLFEGVHQSIIFGRLPKVGTGLIYEMVVNNAESIINQAKKEKILELEVNNVENKSRKNVERKIRIPNSKLSIEDTDDEDNPLETKFGKPVVEDVETDDEDNLLNEAVIS
jgi:DNA-directed RNA polymerase beta subunit